MKKIVLFALAVSTALSSCVKNEVADLNDGTKEISYQAVTALQSRALTATQTAFATTNSFGSFAYMHDGTWANTGSLYINDAEITYNTTDNVWKSATTYYWPKANKLTFFAYTPYTVNATCSAANGIAVKDYSVVNGSVATNEDFMVADIAKDKTVNENIYSAVGVPTLFRHKLTQIGFAVKTDKNYAGIGTQADGDKLFTLNSIKVYGVNTKGDYTQNYSTDNAGAWSKQSTPNTLATAYAPKNADQVITATAAAAGEKTIVLPQPLADAAEIEVVYTITTYVKGSAAVVETVATTKKLNAMNAEWAINKNITYTLTFGLDQILWDPAVENWDNVPGSAAL